MIFFLLACFGLYCAINELQKYLEKRKAAKAAKTEERVAMESGDPSGLTTKIQDWLQRLGIVDKVEAIKAESDLITTFAFLVIAKGRVSRGVADPALRDAIGKHFDEAMALVVSGKVPAEPADSSKKLLG